MVRQDVVERLVDAAADGMIAAADGTSGSEVLSAYLTLALRAVVFTREHGGDLAQVRAAIERIYAEIPTERVN